MHFAIGGFIINMLFMGAWQEPASSPRSAQSEVNIEANGAVAGRVSNGQTGAAVSGANVILGLLAGPANERGPTLSTTSDENGMFIFNRVAPGTYTLRGQASGYLQSSPGPIVHKVTVRSNERITDLELRLSPEARIAGRVVDENGIGVPMVIVRGLVKSGLAGRVQLRELSRTSTNNAGEYELHGLSPGAYTLAAEPAPANLSMPHAAMKRTEEDLPLVSAYYPSAASADQSVPIEVRTGDVLYGVNIALWHAPAYTITGTLAADLRRDTGLERTLQLVADSENYDIASAKKALLMPNGDFRIENVPAGIYKILFTGMDRTAGSGAAANAARPNQAFIRLLASRQILVSSDVNDIVLERNPVVSLSGHIKANSEAVDLSSMHISIESLEPMIFITAATEVRIERDGKFSIPGLDASKYRLRITPPAGSYVKAVRLGKQEISGSILDLRAGISDVLEVDLRDGAAHIGGGVETSSSSAARMVILLHDSFVSGASDAKVTPLREGKFSIKDMQPGRYLAAAVEVYDPDLFRNAAFFHEISMKFLTLYVHEGDTISIQAPGITEEQVSQAALRAGVITF